MWGHPTPRLGTASLGTLLCLSRWECYGITHSFFLVPHTLKGLLSPELVRLVCGGVSHTNI